MNLFGARQKQLLSFLTANAERETLDYVLQGMRKILGEDMPEEDAVRAYLQGPEKTTTLSAEQQIVAMDKLLECAEVNFRMLCDLIRYQQLKDAGVVNSVEEFLRLMRPDDAYLTDHVSAKSSDIAELLGVKSTRAKKLLSELIAEETVVAEGGNRNRTYRLKS